MDLLNTNILHEILRRVDAVTLAKISCVSRDFRLVSEDELLWKDLCNNSWPSTKETEVKSILASVGGYRRFYAQCYPSIVNRQQQRNGHKFDFEDAGCDYDNVYAEPLEALECTSKGMRCSSSDYISIIDVLYDKKAILSRTLKGIPGADDRHGWFSTLPFRIDVIPPSEGDDYSEGSAHTALVNGDDLFSVVSRSAGLKRGNPRSIDGSRLINSIHDKVRLSWILINTKTKQMANLASWKPLGVGHWLGNDDFLLGFGCVLPEVDPSSDPTRPRGSCTMGGELHCKISLVCSIRLSAMDEAVGDTANSNATLRLTDLSLQLEDFEGALLHGAESVRIFQRALNCPKSRNREDVVDSYQRYMNIRSEVTARHDRDDHRVNVAAAGASAIVSCLFILWIMGY